MPHPRYSGVLLAAPRRPGTVRRRRDVAVPGDDYSFDFFFYFLLGRVEDSARCPRHPISRR